MFILGLKREISRDGANLSFHIISVSFSISWLLLGWWKEFLLLRSIHSSSKCLRRDERCWVAWVMTGLVQPWKLYHVFYLTSIQSEWRKEIICKNRFNFKFIFSSPFTLHRHVYYIDFDIIAIILQTMMCFPHLHLLVLHLCVLQSKSIWS